MNSDTSDPAGLHSLPDPAGNETALIAVSGGRDSVALLHMLVSRGGGHRYILCHLNHGLRGRESGQDAAFVRRLGVKYGLTTEIEKRDVAAESSRRRISLETAAREVRYEFLLRCAARHGTDRVYLAHHADDQAETILGNLCRGTGIRGLAGMKRESRSQNGLLLLRPLLSMRRAEIDAYIAAHSLPFREDSSNTSLKHRRNRLRHQVLPLLKEVFARDVSPLIARLGAQAERDEECLRRQAAGFLSQPGIVHHDLSLTINAELKSLHPAILSRVLSLWLTEKLHLPRIETEDLEAALSMLRPGGPAKINLHAGKHLRRRAGKWFVE